MDNGMMENFFGILKTEMYYDQEDKYKNIDELIIINDLTKAQKALWILIHKKIKKRNYREFFPLISLFCWKGGEYEQRI